MNNCNEILGTLGRPGSEFETSSLFVPEGSLADFRVVFKTCKQQTDFLV